MVKVWVVLIEDNNGKVTEVKRIKDEDYGEVLSILADLENDPDVKRAWTEQA